MEGWISDFRYAFRGLRKRPAFAVLVLLTLGLGIGATTTIFSVVDSVMLRPLPYDDPGRIVTLGNIFPGREWSDQVEGLQRLAGVSYLNFAEVRERTRSLTSVAGGERASALLPDEGNGPQKVDLLRITEGFFDLLGVSPILGRTFLPDDFREGGNDRILISHGSWVGRFGSDPDIVGRAFPTASGSYTILGVLPPGFRPPEAQYPGGAEIYLPLDPSHPRYADRGGRSMVSMGRLAEGATLDQLRAELKLVGGALAQEFPDGNVFPDGTEFGWGANTLHSATLGGTGKTLLFFLAASALILLIAVLNAAHLLLVRGLDRAGEISLRRAVGADRWTVARHLLGESVLLGLGGGALGLILAFGGVEAFLRFVPSNLPRLEEVAVDLRVLALCAVVSVGVGIATGLLPALRFGGWDVSDTLKRGSVRSVSSAGSRSRMVLVSAQLALALVLAVGASLLFQSFLRVRGVETGFEPDDLMAFSMPMETPTTSEGPVWAAWEALMREVDLVPGSQAAAGSNLPFESPNWAPWILLPGESSETRRTGIAGYVITPNYLDVLGIPLVEGRAFGAADGPEGEDVVLVNQTFVRDVLGGESGLGREIIFRGEEDEHLPATIVGVVGDVVQTRAEEPKKSAVYVPYTQAEWSYNVRVAVRTERDPAGVAMELRQAAGRFFSSYPVGDISTMRARIGFTRTEPRFQALLLLTFASVAVLLAAVGLFGTLTHMVGRRTRELGIRMALGADRRSIVGLVVGQAAVAAGVGMGVGLVVAFLLTRFLGGFLFEIGTLHFPSFFWASTVLTAGAVLAAMGPARRAVRVDLVESLREE
jgi:putative ABC transport system permease protein